MLFDRLCELLEVEELTIIPTLPYDITGHSDAMIRFIDDDTLLLNDLRLISSDRYWKSLIKSLKKFNLIVLPNNLHQNKEADDATRDYINMILIKDLAFVPSYKMQSD